MFEAVGRQLAAAGQDTERDGKIKRRGLSGEFGRGQGYDR